MIKLLFIFYTCSLFGNIDLEERTQDFILETKQIVLPEYPHAFNPSIVRWNGSLLLSFRTLPDMKNKFTSLLGIVELDEAFNPIGPLHILNTRESGALTPSRAEDGRFLVVNGRLFFIYSDNVDQKITRGGFRVYLAEIIVEDNLYKLINIECLHSFEGNDPNLREKNWTPFEYEGELLLSYSLDPHVIFKPLSGTCETFCFSPTSTSWKWGILRGGTAALKLENQYLAFFHSSIDIETIHSDNKKMAHYFMGAYLYNSEPPFKLTHISPEPLIAKGFYAGTNYTPYWKPVRCVFPCGFIHDEHHIWITYGRDDHEMWVVKIDKERLLDSLVQIE